MQTFIRHFITALGGVLLVDTSSTHSLAFGLIAITAAWLWSVIQKLEWTAHVHLRDDVVDVLKKMAAAAVSQGLAALSGWMMANGFAGDVNDPAAVLLFLSNYGASRMGWHQKALGVKPVMMLVLGSLFSVIGCACSSTSQDALKSRLEAAFVSAGKEVSAVALQSTITTLKQELALLEAKPVDEDPMQQLLDQNRMQAIRAAIRLGEERLKALNVERSTSNVQRSSKAGIEVAPLQVSKAPCLSIPIFAPRVVASLQAKNGRLKMGADPAAF
jgi:hypothetical protein